jgi:hypothetical protein
MTLLIHISIPKRIIKTVYPKYASIALERNIIKKSVSDNINQYVLAPYSFLLSSPIVLIKNQSMRFELTPKNNQRKNAKPDIYQNERERNGNAITRNENKSENIIQ